MCIIVIKPAGAKFPSKSILKECFDNNPDGAGFMFPYRGKVEIFKGYMRFKKFYRALNVFDQDISFPVIYHFRIATTGKVNADNTHPFPISKVSTDLCQWYSVTDLAVCHNGILPIKPYKSLSDTQTFILDMLAGLKKDIINKRPAVMELIELAVRGSRLAFMTGTGEVIKFGSGWIEDQGLIYSNDGYKPSVYEKYCGHTYPIGIEYGDGGDYFCEHCGGKLYQWGQDLYCNECDNLGNINRQGMV